MCLAVRVCHPLRLHRLRRADRSCSPPSRVHPNQGSLDLTQMVHSVQMDQQSWALDEVLPQGKFMYTIWYHMYKNCVIYHGIYQKIWYITWYIPYFTWYIPYFTWYIQCDITFISGSDLLLGHVIYQYFVVIYHGISHSFGIYQAWQAIYHVKCSFDLLLGHVIYLVLPLCTAFYGDIAGRTWLDADVYHTPISQRWYISGYGGIYLTNVWDII
jgi:hypothetical protein